MTKLKRRGKRSALLFVTAASASAAVLVAGAGSILGSESSTAAAAWRVIPPAPIRVDAGLASVWTGKEMLVSGVAAGADGTLIGAFDVAAAYDPAADSWRRLPTPPTTGSHCRRSVAWTGKEMLVWGCGHTAFDPRTNRWRRLPPAPMGAPGLAVWTGRELIGWGGGCCGDASADGAVYDPASDTWRALAHSPLAPSQRPVGAWTGREFVLFVSGLNPDGRPIRGAARAAAYDPATDTWRRIAPPPAFRTSAVWDGHELLLVGGADERGAPATDGYAYDPSTDHWRSLPDMPAGRTQAVAAWAGRQLLLFGGETSSGALLGLNPRSNRWSLLPESPLAGRLAQAAVWTGHELVVWGGVVPTPSGTGNAPEHPVDGAAFAPSQAGLRGAQ